MPPPALFAQGAQPIFLILRLDCLIGFGLMRMATNTSMDEPHVRDMDPPRMTTGMHRRTKGDRKHTFIRDISEAEWIDRLNGLGGTPGIRVA